jgi:hypothetical protein
MSMNLFAQLTKIDEAKRLVFARAAQEVVDKSDEIMDYESSKPFFKSWSEEVSKDSDGKNLGNVRAMHGKVAAGRLTQIDFNDAEKAVDVCAYISDDQEFRKCLDGTYTGLSIGGKYVGDKKVEKIDGKDIKRYTAHPSEISLVDRPCIPTAKFFSVEKADGTLAKVEFQEPAETEDEAEGVVEGTAEQVDQLTKLMADNKLNMAKVIEVVAGSLEKKEPPVVEKADAAPEGIGQEKWDSMSAEDKAKYKAGLKAGTEPDGDEAEKLAKVAGEAWQGALAKVEEALADALTKVGARNSAADKNRINAIHNASAELGADCPATGKAEVRGELQKAEGWKEELTKAVATATEPLQKALTEASEKIAKLEAQPAPSRIKLRAVGKGDDYVDINKQEEVKPVVDGHGEPHEAAGLIKGLHQNGGAPLHALNK